MRKRMCKLFAVCLFIMLIHGCAWGADEAMKPQGLTALSDGWGWPVVVIPPPGGWKSPQGESVKWAVHMAEREISLERGGVHGRDIVFLYSDVTWDSLKTRMAEWRTKQIPIIISFADERTNHWLVQECAAGGPSLVLAGGEQFRLRDKTGRVYKNLFALDLYRNYRANAFAAVARARTSGKGYAVISDPYGAVLARGARLTADMIKKQGIGCLTMWMASAGDQQFSIRISEAESWGAGTIISWLDGIATMSMWKTLRRYDSKLDIWHGGDFDKILTQANGVIIANQYEALVNRKKELKNFELAMVDALGRRVPDGVYAALGYALAKWAISAYTVAGTNDTAAVADGLSRARDIPLLGDTLSINPGTHRPYQRRAAIMQIKSGTPVYQESVTINSQAVAD